MTAYGPGDEPDSYDIFAELPEPVTVSYDLSNSPDRTVTSLIQDGRFVCELYEGDQFTVWTGLLGVYIVIVNPARPPRMYDSEGREQEITFAPADKD